VQAPFLLWRAIHGKAADVKRCFAVRSAFQLFDLDQEESSDTVDNMLRAAMSPVFLRCVEGRRLLASFFDLAPGLIMDLLDVIKEQIILGKASVLDAYGNSSPVRKAAVRQNVCR
jgi:condensin-2 complex subunit G2